MSKEIQIELPGDEEPRVFSDTVRLGRTVENDLAIDDEFVSSAHLEFRPTEDGWEVVDLGSRNGTFVDGEPVRSLPLRHETLVRLGHPGGIELRVTVPGLAPMVFRMAMSACLSVTTITNMEMMLKAATAMISDRITHMTVFSVRTA